jgi:hypothetical protein
LRLLKLRSKPGRKVQEQRLTPDSRPSNKMRSNRVGMSRLVSLFWRASLSKE